MPSITNLFAPALQKIGFFSEWARHVAARATPEILAGLMPEGLRTENSDVRAPFTVFAAYMRSRTWAEVVEDFSTFLSPEDYAKMRAPGGEDFYKVFRDLIIGQVEDYYRQFQAQQPIQPSPEKSKQERIARLIRDEVSLQLGQLQSAIMEQLKKMKDDGEGWKDGSGPKDPKEPS